MQKSKMCFWLRKDMRYEGAFFFLKEMRVILSKLELAISE